MKNKWWMLPVVLLAVAGLLMLGCPTGSKNNESKEEGEEEGTPPVFPVLYEDGLWAEGITVTVTGGWDGAGGGSGVQDAYKDFNIAFAEPIDFTGYTKVVIVLGNNYSVGWWFGGTMIDSLEDGVYCDINPNNTNGNVARTGDTFTWDLTLTTDETGAAITDLAEIQLGGGGEGFIGVLFKHILKISLGQ
jgi:hypothetical protein